MRGGFLSVLNLLENFYFLVILYVIKYRIKNTVNRVKRPILSLISQIIADELQNTLTPICLSLRNNAACCIPLRNLRYLRENRPFTHTKNYVDEYKNNNNGRSHGNFVQTRAESSSLLECYAECRRHS